MYRKKYNEQESSDFCHSNMYTNDNNDSAINAIIF